MKCCICGKICRPKKDSENHGMCSKHLKQYNELLNQSINLEFNIQDLELLYKDNKILKKDKNLKIKQLKSKLKIIDDKLYDFLNKQILYRRIR